MNEYLILKLQGVMQAWGSHTYEDYRPSEIFPTRSGIVGLLAACAGFKHEDKKQIKSLNDAIEISVRADQIDNRSSGKLLDYHTILDARKADGKVNDNAIQSYREYLMDSSFTVALFAKDKVNINIDQLSDWIKKPVFTPYLGRKSCPIGRPLWQNVIQAKNCSEALKKISPAKGTIFTEEKLNLDLPMLQIRDVSISSNVRQFSTRKVYVLNE